MQLARLKVELVSKWYLKLTFKVKDIKHKYISQKYAIEL